MSGTWEDVFALFDAALSMSGIEREAFLDRECGANARLRTKVESLLEAHRDAQGFLSSTAVRASHASGGAAVPPSENLAPGTRIGVFEIESFAGAGGMGEVYRARDTRLDRHVALKILSQPSATDSRRRARFAYEARAIARLSHPHICALYDLGHDEGLDFLVMEYLNGETLASRLRNGPLPALEALRLAIQIAGALEAAHAEGIVHSDLKPANVMLVNGGSARDGRPEAKLLDFGLARFQRAPQISEAGTSAADHAAPTRRGVIAGTPQYMAPEQVRGEEPDPRTDIFSFGCVLYEMVCGRPPFAGDTAQEVMSTILTADPPSLTARDSPSTAEFVRASRRLEKAIGRCLQKPPDQRFNRIADLKVELEEIARTAARVDGRVSKGQWIAVIAGVAAIATVVGWGLRQRAGASPTLPQTAMKVVQLTALNGLEIAPTFSPDGTQVAFSWNGEREDNYDIYVQAIGSSDVRRLTTDPAADSLPTWSPDGQQIAFLRDDPRSGTVIYSVRPDGREERTLTDFRIGAGESASIAWSPDGRGIVGRPDIVEDVAMQGNWALYLIPLDGSPPRKITPGKAPDLDLAPAFSPDGRRLAYAACSGLSRVCDVNVMDLQQDYGPAAPPRRVARAGRLIRSVKWSRDGRSLVYDTNARGPWELWRVFLDGKTGPERLEIPGEHSRVPAIAAGANRLAFERLVELSSVFALRPDGQPEPVLVSSTWDYNPQFSPDGRRIAFNSRRSGDVEEIWLASADGSGARQLTHGPGSRQTLPAWSPDGRRIAFTSTAANGRGDIWVIPADGGTPRQVTDDPAADSAPTWSRDGKRIYFLSDRDGPLPWGDTWQVSAEGGAPTRLTKGGSSPVTYESADGKALIYQSPTLFESVDAKPFSYQTLGDTALMAVPIEGGTPRQLVPCVKSFSFAVTVTGVYFSPCGNRRDRDAVSGFIQTWLPNATIPIQVLDPSTGRVRTVATVKAPFDSARLAVSPDGTRILVHRNTRVSDLMLIENFR